MLRLARTRRTIRASVRNGLHAQQPGSVITTRALVGSKAGTQARADASKPALSPRGDQPWQ